MEASFSSSLKIVTDPRAVHVLTDPNELQYFAPFIARDRSVNAVARETGANANTMFARVRKYLDLGLLKIIREQPRGGRAIRVYRSSADTFFVPHTHVGDAQEHSLRWHGFWEREFSRAFEDAFRQEWPEGGTRLYRDESGVFNMQVARDPDENINLLDSSAPAMFSLFSDAVFLDFQDAKALQRDLQDLMARYQDRRGAGRYAVRLNLVPMLEGAASIP